jgi:aminoglycoside phosphotransferase (APT) family kinase protein
MTGNLPEEPEQARDAATRLLGAPVADVTRVPSFAGNRVFRIAAPTGHLFLKFASAEATAAEHAVLRTVAEHQIPVPTIEAVDLDGAVTGSPCIAMRQVVGLPLSGHESVFERVGLILERLHTIPCDGFGSVRATSGGALRGDNSTWLRALRRRTESARAVAEAGLVPGVLVDIVSDAVANLAPDKSIEVPRLLHGDFHPRHVYAYGDHLTAIIDWGDATAGDPDYDIARILHSIIIRADLDTAIAVARTALPRERQELDAHRLAKLLTYAAVFILWSMHGEYENGAPWPPWWPMQTKALETVLDALATTSGT